MRSYSWAASTGGFIPLSWSDRFHREVGLGAQQASSFPFLPFQLTFPPFSLSIVNPSPPLPLRPGAGQGLFLPHASLCSFAGAARTGGQPRGQRLPWQAGAVYGFWKLCGHGGVEMATVPPGRGRWWAGGQGAAPAGWALKKGIFRGLEPGSRARMLSKRTKERNSDEVGGGAPEAPPTQSLSHLPEILG